MKYTDYQSFRQGTSYAVQEHTTDEQRAAFWQAWHASGDESALAEYIRAHLTARRAA